MTYYKHFKHLHVPDHWEQYWSKYPNGYTILEALISWVSQVDDMADNLNDMADNVNDWNTYLDQFVETFDTKLQANVRETIQEWVDDGSIQVIVSEALQWELDDFKTTTDNEIKQIVKDMGSLRINVKNLPAPYVSAVGDGIADDTQAFQNAFDLAGEQSGGNTTGQYSYIGWYMPLIQVPHGEYRVGKVTTPTRFRLEGDGMSVLLSRDGSTENHVGSFVDNVVVNMSIKNIGFLFYDTVFITPTNNADFSFITFEDCNVAMVKTLIDMVSFSESRSTSFKMERCNVSYGVETLVKLYCDKSYFSNNWFNHSRNTVFMELDTFGTFINNVWVPTQGGLNKAYINFKGSDSVRSLHFNGERFGGEAGSCPIVIVGDVNGENTVEQYRNQGISFTNCSLASLSSYNPDGIAPVRACVILRPSVSKLNTINYVSFENCSFLPDLNGGIVQSYNTTNISTLLPDNFVIDFDYASSYAGVKGINKLAGDDLMEFVSSKVLKQKYRKVSNTGKLTVNDASTDGVKKTTFNVDIYATKYNSSYSFLLSLIGQGDSSYDSYSYSCQSLYILTLSSDNTNETQARISFTKLHGTKGGAAQSANADIVSAHFGVGETGLTTLPITSSDHVQKSVTIVFGNRVKIGSAYLTPLYDPMLEM